VAAASERLPLRHRNTSVSFGSATVRSASTKPGVRLGAAPRQPFDMPRARHMAGIFALEGGTQFDDLRHAQLSARRCASCGVT
jgi:hypothetical protein